MEVLVEILKKKLKITGEFFKDPRITFQQASVKKPLKKSVSKF